MATDFQKIGSLFPDLLNKLREHELRAPCKICGDTIGRIYSKGGQDSVFCRRCSTFQYNAPRTETGREVRTLQTIRHIAPSQRSRILERAHSRCEVCGSESNLTIGHFLSVKDGFDFVTDEQLNSDENLLAQCAECNAGQGDRTMPLWHIAAILAKRAK